MDIKEIKEELKSIHETLLRNTLSLEMHEKRTGLAEQRLDRLEAGSKWSIGIMITTIVSVIINVGFHFLKR